MFRIFEGETADAVWRQIAKAYCEDQFAAGQASRAGGTSEILHAAITIRDPRQRWVASRHPALNLAFALAETVWIMRGRNDAAFVNYFSNELPKYAGAAPVYHGAYGYRLRRWFGFDQLERAYRALKHNPSSRQVALQIWDAKADFPDNLGVAADPDIPCNVTSLLKVREGRLEWLQVMRSNDVFRGVPYNVVQFTLLQEVLAGWLGLDVGEYHHLSDSLHVYDNTAPLIRAQTAVDIAESSDNLAVPKAQSDEAFAHLDQLVRHVITSTCSIEDLLASLGDRLPEGFHNIGLVLCAEGARRRKDRQAAGEIMERCTNVSYRQLYGRWLERTAPKG